MDTTIKRFLRIIFEIGKHVFVIVLMRPLYLYLRTADKLDKKLTEAGHLKPQADSTLVRFWGFL